ncbi:type II secretion system secretin GspD [Stutzerimonas stutzeri]|uniref:type II secretion system secretin GspD n=1 Tax=Stutzerimonas stutzeri TaxID=316 RepID=UPI0015E40098|nr:type II secretion system secretin GspD [Stutzerimonas stutzeri]MBA1276268.1 type II secretion system secretin GspD [Stutzerimonas stutzeri]
MSLTRRTNKVLLTGLIAASCLASICIPSLVIAANPAAESSEERWTINMRDTDIRDFIEQVSSIGGQTFIVDPRVKGQVTVIAQEPLSLAELYQLFLSVMATHGFAVLPQGAQTAIVPNVEARAEAGSGGNLETRVLQVQHGSVGELAALIRPLVAGYGHLAAVPSANSLIVSDRPANIARIEDVLRQLDSRQQRDYSIYELRHIWVRDAAQVLGESLKHGQTDATQVIADHRANRLILLGPPQARARLLQLVQSLDTPSSRSSNTRVIRLRYGDAKNLATTLGELAESMVEPDASGNTRPRQVMIRADESLNALVILAEPDMLGALEDLVRQLDVPRAQVLVEAAIIEMSGDVSEALGVQWAIDGRNGGLGGVNFSNTGLSIGTLLGALGSEDPSRLAGALPNGAIVGVGNDNFGALITALSATGKSNLLSTPTLLTLDNQPAEILVGQNVPFQTGSYTTTSDGASNPFTTIEREDIGVSLKITPHINDGSTLRLEIEQEISTLVNAPTGIQVADVITNKRSIKSTILADDGQVIVLGGLIQDDVTQSMSKVPLLGDIPLLGRLFRSSRDSRVKRNLMVFLRPSVTRDGAGLSSLSLGKYQEMHGLSRSEAFSGSSLPDDPRRLFDRSGTQPELDLRAQPAPDEAPRALAIPPQPALQLAPPTPAIIDIKPAETHQSHTIQLVAGSNSERMRALVERHPEQPLRLLQGQRQGGPWYSLTYGDYPSKELARQALDTIPPELPKNGAFIVSRSQDGS